MHWHRLGSICSAFKDLNLQGGKYKWNYHVTNGLASCRCSSQNFPSSFSSVTWKPNPLNPFTGQKWSPRSLCPYRFVVITSCWLPNSQFWGTSISPLTWHLLCFRISDYLANVPFSQSHHSSGVPERWVKWWANRCVRFDGAQGLMAPWSAVCAMVWADCFCHMPPSLLSTPFWGSSWEKCY